jgi:hypothetical protein
MKKKSLLLFAVLGICLLFNVVCPNLTVDHHGIELHQDGNCSFLSHSTVLVGAGLSYVFALPLIGLFFLMSISFAPQRFVSAPFKPPRFHS